MPRQRPTPSAHLYLHLKHLLERGVYLIRALSAESEHKQKHTEIRVISKSRPKVPAAVRGTAIGLPPRPPARPGVFALCTSRLRTFVFRFRRRRDGTQAHHTVRLLDLLVLYFCYQLLSIKPLTYPVRSGRATQHLSISPYILSLQTGHTAALYFGHHQCQRVETRCECQARASRRTKSAAAAVWPWMAAREPSSPGHAPTKAAPA